MKSNRKLKSSSYPLLALLALSLLVSIMAETGNGSGEAEVHIVYTEKPEGEEPEAYHVRTLATVLGSEEAAKEAIIYSYKTAASGGTRCSSGGQKQDIPAAFRASKSARWASQAALRT
ncbi:hypothetical protein Sjap_017987 [Stephania japonica]|uniref:Uncharacterized protein n=1 Tax=Stephania japonica TaxID=461633 RepID=A0AAP0NIV7_9MAGN